MVPSRIVISIVEITCSNTKFRSSPGSVRRLGATILVAGCTLGGRDKVLVEEFKGKVGNSRDFHIYISTYESESDKKKTSQAVQAQCSDDDISGSDIVVDMGR